MGFIFIFSDGFWRIRGECLILEPSRSSHTYLPLKIYRGKILIAYTVSKCLLLIQRKIYFIYYFVGSGFSYLTIVEDLNIYFRKGLRGGENDIHFYQLFILNLKNS
jgi:hypothetical protein